MDIHEALENAYPLLRGILSAAPDGVLLYDPQGRCIFANGAVQAFWGLPEEHLRGKTWREMGLTEELGTLFEGRLAQVVRDRTQVRAEERLDSGQGGTRQLETLLSPVLDGDGKVVAVLAILRDITGRRTVEEARRQSEEKFEQVFRLTPDAVALTRVTDGTYLDVNEAFLRITGYRREDLLSRSSLELGIWADAQQREKLLSEMEEHQEMNGLETLFRRKDGSLLTGLMSARRVAMGGESCILSVTTDITERKAMETALRESESRFRQLIEQAADGIFQGAPDGTVITVNPKGCELTGYRIEEILGRNLAFLFSREELERVQFRYDLLDEGRTVVSERFITRRDGTPLPIEMSTRKMADGTYLSFFRDISDRLAAEQKLRDEEATLASIIDSNPYAIQVVDAEGHHIRHNRAFLDLFGSAPPPEYSILEDPSLRKAGFLPRLQEALQGRRIAFPDLWYDAHDADPAVPSHRRCLRSTAFPLGGPERGVQHLVVMHEDITEWKEAEETLRRQEEQYRSLFFTMAQGVIYQDAEGRVLSGNPAAEQILGLSLDQMMGRTSIDPRWDCIHEDGTPFPGETHPAMVALRTGKPVQGMVMGLYHPEEARHRWAVVNATPEFRPGEEQPWRVFTTFTDITELKAAQDAQQLTAQRLQGVMNNSQAVIFQLDPEGRFLLSEGRDLAILGLQPGQVVGLSALDMYRESPSTLEALRRALAGETCHASLEVRGHVFDTNLSPVFDRAGRLESVIGVSTNITERVKVEQALRESEQKFRDLIGKLGEGFSLLDPEENFTFANAAAEAIFGVGEGQLVGRNLRDFLDPEGFRMIQERTERLKAGEKGSFELPILRPNQELRHIAVNVTPILDARGAYLGANGLIQDITERRQAEDALRQTQKLESLGVLAGGIAHDFNNLLTAILGNLNLAQGSLAEDSAALPFLENMEKTVLRAADLTRQMLAYSGRGRFEVKLHDLNGVVQEMTQLLLVSIPKKAKLRFLLSPGVLPIEADATQIHQVVMNLVTNASDAIGEDEGTITVATRLESLGAGEAPSASPGQTLPPGPYAVLEVDDSGCGMEARVLERIFDPFFSTKARGRGLGLSAMLGILRAHKAGIRIRSQVERGSTFTVFLPLAGENPPARSPSAAGGEGQFTGEALVVDDEPSVLEFAGRAMERLGFRTTTARDGLEAVELFSQAPHRFDLVLLDLTMPRMDGREALRELRHLRPGIPVILSSGYSDQECLQDLPSEKDLLFLPKPYLLRDLERVIQKLLERPETRGPS